VAKKLGLVLGSGAARGWAHVGVLRGLKEIGMEPDIIAGCSVGALVGGAYVIGALDEFESWARELKPLSALERFTLKVRRGGLIDTAPAFDAFRSYDKNIETLAVKFAAIAADLATGEEVAITTGSVIDAARASSAIPVIFHSVEHEGRWFVDGALANPAPVSHARAMGADVVLAVDLNAVPRVLDRFDAPAPSLPVSTPSRAPKPGLSGAVAKLIEETRGGVRRQFDLAKARADAAPHLFETAYAAADIFQMHLARARARTDPPDILLRPDMRDAMPTAFDRADEFIEEGRKGLLGVRTELEALLER
jgi:NTE family protein